MLTIRTSRAFIERGFLVGASLPALSGLTFFALAILIAFLPLPSLMIALVAITGAFFALIFPWLAWLGLAFILPVSSGLRLGPASITDALFVTALALWCAAMVVKRSPFITNRIPVWSVTVYGIVLYMSTLGAIDLDEALTEMVKWIEFGILIAIVPIAFPAKRVSWLVAALLTAAALQGVYGLYQFIFRIGPEWFLIQGRFMRASGVFGQPNPFGAYLGLSLPVGVSLSMWGISALWRQRNRPTLLWTSFYVVATGCIAVGLVASWSRGGWLGALAGIMVVLAFFSHRTALMLAFGGVALTVAALLGTLNPTWIPTSITARLGDIPAYLGIVDVLTLEVNDDNFAIIERVAHWVAALRMWEISPWLGVGPGNYSAAYATVALPRWSDPLGHAHNIYLNVLGETGILGLGAFLLMWSSLIGWLVQQLRLLPQTWARALTVGVLGVVAHLAVHSFFDNLFVQGMYLHVALWLAAVALTANSNHSTNKGLTSATFAESDG